jgi:hypothetical protein
MIDRSALEPWIQPRHLDEESLERCRKEMFAHPAKMLLLEDFLVPAKADKLTRFLEQEAQFGKEYGLYSDGSVSEEAWEAADAAARMSRLSRLAGIPSEFQMSPNALTYLQFRQALQQPAFIGFFEAATGLDLGGSDDFGVHAMSEGDFLRPHSDDIKGRRIALVIYLSEDWQASYGGTLVMTDPTGSDSRVDPKHNSIVIFDVLADTMHQVEPITAEAAGRARYTIGGWYPDRA